jgi:fructosamine-3-kinase
MAARNRLPSQLIDRGERLAADCGAFFRTYRARPSLLHGDLWGGNASSAAGKPVVFDPAVYVGDREADLAMTELFGGFPPELLAAYRADLPLDEGYTVRRELLQPVSRPQSCEPFRGRLCRTGHANVERLLAEIG